MLPQKILEFRGYEISRFRDQFWVNTMLFRSKTQFHMHNLRTASYTALVSVFRSFASLSCLHGRTETCWRKTRKSSFALFTAISQVSTRHLCASGPCVGVRRAMALIGYAKQASGEWESSPVETRLTRPAAVRPCIAAHDLVRQGMYLECFHEAISSHDEYTYTTWLHMF